MDEEFNKLFDKYKSVILQTANRYNRISRNCNTADYAIDNQDLYQIGCMVLFDCYNRYYKKLTDEQFKAVFVSSLTRKLHKKSIRFFNSKEIDSVNSEIHPDMIENKNFIDGDNYWNTIPDQSSDNTGKKIIQHEKVNELINHVSNKLKNPKQKIMFHLIVNNFNNHDVGYGIFKDVVEHSNFTRQQFYLTWKKAKIIAKKYKQKKSA